MFTKFVEVGRVVEITYGPGKGHVAPIVAIIDQHRALIEGPTTGVSRREINFKRVRLTNIKLNIPRNIRTAALKKACVAQKLNEQWEATNRAQLLQKKKLRRNMNDFQRFQVKTVKAVLTKAAQAVKA
ncbi:hypothetical protein CXG81DRAFT_17481 [Caulochytrium protostelioides]|uniref:Large ribosomal subunit protein eL14 domain-containing protein n=1 Tax=Caulochytrium protostelioides TaxID=1555241 RepID=A0A4P9XBQ4_9FUNG|nr:hypothetical protein CXG81DRAFT_17481 [Caulochytrium protostelioides]|eukprot:RKP02857.1 hypothetical protein CXG81DRAFT_17481 [Caulochytrium protostelioides]